MFVTIVRRHPVMAFFCLAFGLSWSVQVPAVFVTGWPELLTFLGSFGPAVAAFTIVSLVEGSEGVRRLISGLAKWRAGIGWYVAALLGPAVTVVVSILVYPALGKGSGLPDTLQIWPMFGVHVLGLAAIFVYQLLTVWGEELGWRGYALPRLQARYHPIVASVIVGLVWGLWHLPWFWIEGSAQQNLPLWFFVLASIGYSVLYTWIYNGTAGSLWMMCLLHAANNTTVSYTMLFFSPFVDEPLFSLAILALFDLLIIVIAGPGLHRQQANANQPSQANP